MCLYMCVKMNVTICVSLHPPEACTWWPVCVCDSLCRNLPAYFSIQLIICVCFTVSVLLQMLVLLIGAPLLLPAWTGLFSGHCTHRNV